jgi:hypothetical protein
MMKDMGIEEESGGQGGLTKISEAGESAGSQDAGKSYTAKLCFVVDCTASMGYAIMGAKDKIGEIVDEAYAKFPSIALEFGFVGYRDYTDSKPFEIVPFTSIVDEFIAGVQPIEAQGGGDEAEDVLGGMQTTLDQMNWQGARVKMVFHIGDSPHHGARFHDGRCGDNHEDKVDSPRPSSEILSDFATQHIDYYFATVSSGGRITTAVMAKIFEEEYNARQARKRNFTIMDLATFTTDGLFTQVMSGLSMSVLSFLDKRR